MQQVGASSAVANNQSHALLDGTSNATAATLKFWQYDPSGGGLNAYGAKLRLLDGSWRCATDSEQYAYTLDNLYGVTLFDTTDNPTNKSFYVFAAGSPQTISPGYLPPPGGATPYSGVIIAKNASGAYTPLVVDYVGQIGNLEKIQMSLIATVVSGHTVLTGTYTNIDTGVTKTITYNATTLLSGGKAGVDLVQDYAGGPPSNGGCLQGQMFGTYISTALDTITATP